MTYNWNTMVEITVPTGTNGWLYSGEVIINGVKVRFPVGTPTSVPEPAAVLLKKMIELEKEEDANTAKPQNHYVGSVTIPAGKTLTLEKGAKFVDNSGGGEVVILPETELVHNDGVYHTTALQAMPEAGKTYAATYNGTVYDCPAVAFEMSGVSGVAMGNTDAYGIPGGNANAPFILTCMQDGEVMGAELVPTDSPASVTLSIVEKAETASAGGGVCIVNVSCETADMQTFTNITKDKTYAELKAAYDAGSLLWCRLHANVGGQSMTAECPLFGATDTELSFWPLGYFQTELGVLVTINNADVCDVFVD